MKKLWPDWRDMHTFDDPPEPWHMTRGHSWLFLTLAMYGVLKAFAVFQVARGAWAAPPGARLCGLWISASHEAITLLMCGVSAGILLVAIWYSRWCARWIAHLRRRTP